MPSLILWKNQHIDRLRKDMDRIFDRIWGEFGTKLTPQIGGTFPFIDLTETDDNLILIAEIPGVSSKDLEVDIVEDMLTIRGEKKQEKVDEKEGYHRTERSYGSFSRRLQLPCRVMIDDVTATYKKGILKIVMPKCAPEKARKIKIRLK